MAGTRQSESVNRTESEHTESVGTDAVGGEDLIFKLRDVDVSFDMNRGQARVIDGVDIDIYRGETLGVVGESGSGKSMFASSLLDAVVDPGRLSGEITYYPESEDPVDLLSLSDAELREVRWEEIAMVFQGAMGAFNPTMTIGEHFEETIESHDYDSEEGMEMAHQLISDLHMEPERILESYPHTLSGGQKQRSLIALSLVLNPEVLVMDEPTAALDLLMQRSILNLLYEVKDKYDITIVFISHDIPIVSGFADRLAIMYAFEFVEKGPATSLLKDPSHPYSRSLLKSTPNLDTPMDEMEPIVGDSPDPVNPPQGCSYHPRCPLADDRCRTEEPGFHDIGPDHQAACFNWEEAEDAIQLSFARDRERSSPEERTGERSGRATASSRPVISIEDVDVHFAKASLLETVVPKRIKERFEWGGGDGTVRAVDDVDLDLDPNDVVALVGESGCGKTTLGKTAVGLQRPTDGHVTYNGTDIWDVRDGEVDADMSFEEIRRALQIIHQDPDNALNPYQSVEDILSTPLKRWEPHLNFAQRHDRILRMLRRVGITPAEDYIERYPHQLSGGEKQRIALVRAMSLHPDVILADEAVSALDVSLRIDIMDLMLELQEMFETSYLFISHNLSNARYLAGMADGKIAVMYLGEIVERGPASEIINNPQHPYTKVLKWATPVLDPDEAAESMREDPPMRGIDIPDATNPPSGCRFHTRCPEAREVCTRESPELMDTGGPEEGAAEHETACFRQDEDHEYWDSEPIEESAE
jgi:peptide/nickel transport system ATP-binding protein